MGDLSPHFSKSEFACHCGCGEVAVSLALIDALETLRTALDAPIIITSGYRCPKHNAEIGGVEDSQHTEGTAADCFSPGLTPMQLGVAAMKLSAFNKGGVGIYSRPDGTGWTHLDVRNHGPARWIKDLPPRSTDTGDGR